MYCVEKRGLGGSSVRRDGGSGQVRHRWRPIWAARGPLRDGEGPVALHVRSNLRSFPKKLRISTLHVLTAYIHGCSTYTFSSLRRSANQTPGSSSVPECLTPLFFVKDPALLDSAKWKLQIVSFSTHPRYLSYEIFICPSS